MATIPLDPNGVEYQRAFSEIMELKLNGISARIYSYLKSFEDDKEGANKPPREGGPSPFYKPCVRVGARYIYIGYVSYHYKHRLTKKEAAHYLAQLTLGFRGKHYDAYSALAAS